ncbi:MAG TPA: hypothetical protein VH583_11480 [Vicinamibacterales bacterium]|jgi:hypothetical protein
MRTIGSWTRSALSVLALAASATVAVSTQQPSPDLDGLLTRVGERIERYYKRVQQIICTEKVTATPIGLDFAPSGFGRVLEYELRVESDESLNGDPADAKVVRDLRKVNGRTPKEKDEPGCYDPNPLSTEPLSFLLASHRAEYVFTWAGFGKGKDRDTFLIDFKPIESGKPELMEDARGRRDCFSVTMPGATKGRIWVDSATHDVLRIEEHLRGPMSVSVSADQQRKHNLPPMLLIERYDWAIRYKAVAFEDPAEMMLLPDSIELLAVMHGAQSHRNRQVFSDYKRFMTGARLVK